MRTRSAKRSSRRRSGSIRSDPGAERPPKSPTPVPQVTTGRHHAEPASTVRRQVRRPAPGPRIRAVCHSSARAVSVSEPMSRSRPPPWPTSRSQAESADGQLTSDAATRPRSAEPRGPPPQHPDGPSVGVTVKVTDTTATAADRTKIS